MENSKKIDDKNPLIVDLDGTLIKTDSLLEYLIICIKKNPLNIFKLLIKFFFGRANLKKYLSDSFVLNVSSLPYNNELINFLKAEKKGNRKIYLCSGADKKFASSIASYLNLFEDTYATENGLNLVGKEKSSFLVRKFGVKNFDYVGNSKDDIEVWKNSKNAIIVSNDNKLINIVKDKCNVTHIFKSCKINLSKFLRLIRVSHWSKNLLIYVPLIAAHEPFTKNIFSNLFLGFLLLSLTCSFTYIINDLIDLQSDRSNPFKNSRPISSGDISIKFALNTLLVFILSFFLINYLFTINKNFLYCIFLYLLVSISYSVVFKKIIYLDCIILSLLFYLRLLAGASFISTSLSSALTQFAFFTFLSLAFLKRHSELLNLLSKNVKKIPGRNFKKRDIKYLKVFGILCICLSSFILFFYFKSYKITTMYASPCFLWFFLVVYVVWILRLYYLSIAKNIYIDPIEFAMKDNFSYLAFFLSMVLYLLSRFVYICSF